MLTLLYLPLQPVTNVSTLECDVCACARMEEDVGIRGKTRVSKVGNPVRMGDYGEC